MSETGAAPATEEVDGPQIVRVGKVRVLPDGRVTRKDAATYLGRQPKTLAMWSLTGYGPPPLKVGGRVYYRLSDLERFASGEATSFARLVRA